jgi:hypothetical protein
MMKEAEKKKKKKGFSKFLKGIKSLGKNAKIEIVTREYIVELVQDIIYAKMNLTDEEIEQQQEEYEKLRKKMDEEEEAGGGLTSMMNSSTSGMKKSTAAMKSLGKGTKGAWKATAKMTKGLWKKKKDDNGNVVENDEMFGGALMEDPEGEDLE